MIRLRQAREKRVRHCFKRFYLDAARGLLPRVVAKCFDVLEYDADSGIRSCHRFRRPGTFLLSGTTIRPIDPAHGTGTELS